MAVSLPPQPWTEGMSFVVDETGLEYTFNGEVWLSEGEPIDLSQYATKSDLESLEAELELLAKTLEHGSWAVSDTPMVRPGQMHLAFDQFSAQKNVLTINNEDLGGTTHGWANVHEGDYIELIDKTDQQNRNIDHDYALFLVTKVDKGNGIATIDLDLYQGQGDCLPDEVFEVRVIDIAESELDMAALDERYIRKEAENSTYKDWLLKADGNKRNPDDFAPKHSHPYASSSHTHSGLGGSVELKHGSSTAWESNHSTYGCGKWFAWYRRSDGYKLEATYSKKLSELGKIKFVCNSSGFENKFGRAGVLIGSKNNDPNMYPHVVMNIWKTSQQLVSGYVNMTFEGTVLWVTDPNMTLQNVPNLYWTWVGDAK